MTINKTSKRNSTIKATCFGVDPTLLPVLPVAFVLFSGPFVEGDAGDDVGENSGKVKVACRTIRRRLRKIRRRRLAEVAAASDMMMVVRIEKEVEVRVGGNRYCGLRRCQEYHFDLTSWEVVED